MATRKQNASALSTAWNAYLSCLAAEPIATKMATGGILSAIGNLVSQKASGEDKPIDWSRVRGFVLANAALSPIAHFWLKFLDTLTENIFLKTFYDRAIFGPPFNAAFMFLATVFQGKPISAGIEILTNGTYLTALKAGLKLWPPVQLFNFKFVPPNLRLPFINAFALIWMVMLSAMMGKKNENNKKLE